MIRSYRNKLKKVDRRKKLDRVEKLLLRGVTNQTEIAAALGLSQPYIHTLMKEVQARWESQADEDLKKKRALRIRQFEYI